MTLVAAAAANPTPSPNADSVSSREGNGDTLKQTTLDFSGQHQQQMTKAKLNTLQGMLLETCYPCPLWSLSHSELSLLKYQYEEEDRGLPHAETLLLNS